MGIILNSRLRLYRMSLNSTKSVVEKLTFAFNNRVNKYRGVM